MINWYHIKDLQGVIARDAASMPWLLEVSLLLRLHHSTVPRPTLVRAHVDGSRERWPLEYDLFGRIRYRQS